MRWVILLFYVVLIAGATYLVWQNRASERILSTVLPIPTAALIGILVFLAFAQAEPISAIIPTTFLLDSKTKLPLILFERQTSTSGDFLVIELQKRDPKTVSDTENILLYHHAIQAAIVDEMGLYFSGTWLPRIDRLRTGGGNTTLWTGGSALSSDKLSTKELDERLKDNLFVGIHTGIPPELTVPRNTRLEVKAPTDKTNGTIRLVQSGFFDVTIETSFAGGGVGLGTYGLFFPEPQGQLQQLYSNAGYMIRITATFSGYRSGHPDMPQYRAWVNTIVEVLRNSFDEEQAWAHFKEILQIRKQFGK